MRTTLRCTAIHAMLVIGSIAVLGCGAADENTQEAPDAAGEQVVAADIPLACDVFTLEMAREFLGQGARQSEISAPFAGSTDDIAGSTCTYEAEDPTPAGSFASTLTATLQLNGARTDTGRRSIRSQFDSGRTELEQMGASTETVTGLGDAAFYMGDVINQMHVLLGDGDYVMITSVMDPEGDDRAATERLARLVAEKL
ncbi:MAG: hypothetical protein ACYC28_07310 [Longimicrobiales bacterium]